MNKTKTQTELELHGVDLRKKQGKNTNQIMQGQKEPGTVNNNANTDDMQMMLPPPIPPVAPEDGVTAGGGETPGVEDDDSDDEDEMYITNQTQS